MRFAVLALCLLLATHSAGQDSRLTIHGGAPDFLALGANSSATPVDLVRFLLSSPGSAADGAPFSIAGMEPSQCASARGVAVHPNGRFIVVASDTGAVGSVCVFEFDARALTLTPVAGSPFPAGRGTRAVAIDPAGRLVYAANFIDGSITGYSINAATGELNALGASPFVSADSNTGYIVVDPLGRFVYTTNSDANNPSVSGFALDGGGLSPVPFSPNKTTSVPGALAIDPRGRYLYVAASPNQVYSIDPATGRLTATADTFGPFAEGMAIDPAGRYLYTTSGSGAGGRVNAYRLGGSSVTPIGTGSPTGNTPIGVAVSRDGRHVYTANSGDGTVSGFRIDDATGALTPIEGSPFVVGGSVSSVAAFGALAADQSWKQGDARARPIGVYGGRLPYTWAISQGTLPPGLGFLADIGVVAGTPTAPGTYAFTARVTDVFAGVASRSFTFTVKSDASPLATVVEYYNAGLDHYFITWLGAEIAALDAGTAIKGWNRTGRMFNTYVSVQPGSSPICRYYIPPAQGDSHFFGRGTAECKSTGAQHPTFVLEDAGFMYMVLPAAGVCPAGTTPVYRVFSNRADANHRYMTDRADRDAMQARGWVAEGDGPDLVVMCAP